MLISVIMAAYNSEKYIKKAIESILNQTYKNFEFIIIDDASVDNTLKIIQEFSDPRIIIICHKNNLGLPRSLNEGIELAKGDFIARMDADDISFPMRFEKQLEYLKENEQISICGTWGYQIDEFGKKRLKLRAPLSDEKIKARLLCNNFIIHPSVMFRKSIFDRKKYDESYKSAQDYMLWAKCYDESIHIMPEFLIYYRKNTAGISVNQRKDPVERIRLLMGIYKVLLKNNGVELTESELFLYVKSMQNLTLFENRCEQSDALKICKKVIAQTKCIDKGYVYMHWMTGCKKIPGFKEVPFYMIGALIKIKWMFSLV